MSKRIKTRIPIHVTEVDGPYDKASLLLCNRLLNDRTNRTTFKDELLKDLLFSVGLDYDSMKEDEAIVAELKDIIVEFMLWSTGSVSWKDRYNLLLKKLRRSSNVPSDIIELWVDEVDEETTPKRIQKPRATFLKHPDPNELIKDNISNLIAQWKK